MSDHVTLPRKQVKGLYRAVVGFLAVTVLLGGPLLGVAVQQERTNNHQAATDRRLEALIRSEAAEDRVEEAEQCVASWEGRVDIRNQAEAVYRRNARTLLDLADNPGNPRITAYREQVEFDVDEIRAELPDPECSLGHARRVLEKEN